MSDPPAGATGDVTSSLERFARDQPIELVVTGRSMEPLLVAGTRVRVMSRRFYWPGDVIAYRSADGAFWMHRLVGYRPRRKGLFLVTRGDASTSLDPLVARARVIGRVVAVADGAPGEKIALRVRMRALSFWLRRLWARRFER